MSAWFPLTVSHYATLIYVEPVPRRFHRRLRPRRVPRHSLEGPGPHRTDDHDARDARDATRGAEGPTESTRVADGAGDAAAPGSARRGVVPSDSASWACCSQPAVTGPRIR